jgi:long-chain acyl-CoA synthetase
VPGVQEQILTRDACSLFFLPLSHILARMVMLCLVHAGKRAGGQHVVPSVLEDKVREHWLIAECVVAGDRRPYVVALVTLDEAAFARWKKRQGKPAGATIGELRDDPDLLAVVQQAVDRANAAVSRPETIKRFRVLPGPVRVGAELTPTGKVRRDYVLAMYASDIDALYA